ncbi:YitT family protein [Pelagibacterales bacterium SAG-MED45]|nr:YitT family protein [Pelagibacterales bacterium SAG-MED45]MBD1133561.1 YitT family protein [Pelagibacterales bacterium SAG-MED44]
MFLKIKKIPKVIWSSQKPYDLKPGFLTLFFCCFGLVLFGLGEGLLIVSFTGASPWSVLAQGISLNVNLSIGIITFLISIFVLILWIPLGQKLGIATILNAIIIAVMIDVCIKYVPTPSNYYNQLILAIVSVITVGIGGGIYLVSNLGAGPRDGLMVGLQKKTNLPIALVRATLEISVVSVGWYLGGVVGIGTLLFAFGIGPCVAFGLYLVDKIFN